MRKKANIDVIKKKNSERLLFIWALAGALILLGLIFISGDKEKRGETLRSPAAGDEVIVVIDYGNGDVRRFRGGAKDGEIRAWDALQQVAFNFGIFLDASSDFVPEKIDGFESASGKSWNLYVNGERQEASPLDVVAKKGDILMFKFE